MPRILALLGALALAAIPAHAAPYFGTTYGDGANGAGTIFEWVRSPDGRMVHTTIYDFCAAPNCADGGNPRTNVIALADGSLIGTTSSGGHGAGTIFRLVPAKDGTWAMAWPPLLDFCLYFDRCGRYGRARGTITLIGPHKIMGTVSCRNGRGALWTFDWHAWGNVFSPIAYWGGK